MTPQPRYRRNKPAPPPPPSIRQLWKDAKWHYQQYAHATERMDDQIRLVMAAQRTDLKRVANLMEQRQRHLANLWPILQEIADRVKRSGKRPAGDIDDTMGFLTTKARSIAEAANKRDFEF